MIPEITIKISFGREAAEVSAASPAVTVRAAGTADIAPPELPAEAQAILIPPPPTLEEALRETRHAMAIPPPSTIGASEADLSALPPPE